MPPPPALFRTCAGTPYTRIGDLYSGLVNSSYRTSASKRANSGRSCTVCTTFTISHQQHEADQERGHHNAGGHDAGAQRLDALLSHDAQMAETLLLLLRVVGHAVAEAILADVAAIAAGLVTAALHADHGLRFANCTDLVDRIWAIGPKKCATNVLLNITDFRQRSIWPQGERVEKAATAAEPRADVESSFPNGFELAVLAGPLVEEPLHGVQPKLFKQENIIRSNSILL